MLSLKTRPAPACRPALSELERYLAVAAYIVVRHGDAYVPTFERMEREVEAARQHDGTRSRAEQVLAALMQNSIIENLHL